jgi:signal transduction histidine kinase
MPGGGTLTLATAYDSARERVRVTVTDTGVGMNPATLARAFASFFTTRDVGEGRELGVSVVYGLVSRSGRTLRGEPGRQRHDLHHGVANPCKVDE